MLPLYPTALLPENNFKWPPVTTLLFPAISEMLPPTLPPAPPVTRIDPPLPILEEPAAINVFPLFEDTLLPADNSICPLPLASASPVLITIRPDSPIDLPVLTAMEPEFLEY